jgi:hypothetical protein
MACWSENAPEIRAWEAITVAMVAGPPWDKADRQAQARRRGENWPRVVQQQRALAEIVQQERGIGQQARKTGWPCGQCPGRRKAPLLRDASTTEPEPRNHAVVGREELPHGGSPKDAGTAGSPACGGADGQKPEDHDGPKTLPIRPKRALQKKQRDQDAQVKGTMNGLAFRWQPPALDGGQHRDRRVMMPSP